MKPISLIKDDCTSICFFDYYFVTEEYDGSYFVFVHKGIRVEYVGNFQNIEEVPELKNYFSNRREELNLLKILNGGTLIVQPRCNTSFQFLMPFEGIDQVEDPSSSMLSDTKRLRMQRIPEEGDFFSIRNVYYEIGKIEGNEVWYSPVYEYSNWLGMPLVKFMENNEIEMI